MLPVSSWLTLLRQRLTPVSDTASLDAQVLLGHVLKKPRAWVLAHPGAIPTPEQARALEEALACLERGQPLPYILGHWEFFGLDFQVTPATLIPRPSTERLVEYGLDWLRDRPRRRLALDIGTGSGCIAVSLAVNMPDLRIMACDFSLEALKVARQNAQKHGVNSRIYFTQSDLQPVTCQSFDLLCANLPYIPTETLKSLQVARYEPHLSLDGGPDGLDLIRKLLHIAPVLLAAGGLALLEIEASQGATALALARAAFAQADIQVLPDLDGLDRLVKIQG